MELHRVVASPPIFVLGAPYSGKGLLGWALAQHPAIVHTTGNEWLAGFAADLQLRYEVATRHGRQFKLDPLTIERDRFYRAFGDAINQLVLESVAAEAASAGVPARWVDSTAGQSAAAVGLARLFPQARFVHLVRDPESTVRGLATVSSNDGTPVDDEVAYKRWVETTKECVELEIAFGSERVLRVDYDDLTASPERTLRRLFVFVGESFCAESLRPIEAAVLPRTESIPQPAGRDVSDATARDARLLSGLLGGQKADRYPGDSPLAARIEARFIEAARSGFFEVTTHSLPAQVQRAVSSRVPPGRTVAVISKGDEELVRVHGRPAWHFPKGADGSYAGYHPGSSEDAIEHLESLRRDGAAYLVIPAPSMWWLDHYGAFARHLLSQYQLVFYDPQTCVIFALDNYLSAGLDHAADTIRSHARDLNELARPVPETDLESLGAP